VKEAVSDQLEEGARRLAERVRAQFDPQAALA
jgi:hypothetical protein